jgi:hypothetical protein
MEILMSPSVSFFTRGQKAPSFLVLGTFSHEASSGDLPPSLLCLSATLACLGCVAGKFQLLAKLLGGFWQPLLMS